MRFIDILKMSSGNLWRRKLRSVLTILGVLIGTTSVVVMISLGIGLKESLMGELGAGIAMDEIVINYEGDDVDKYLTDSVIKDFEKSGFVAKSYPRLITAVEMSQGVWNCHALLLGIPQEKVDEIEIEQGRGIDQDAEKLEFIVGGNVIQNAYNSRTGEYPYYDDNEKLADMDMLNETVYFYFRDENTQFDENGNPIFKGKKSIAPICGMTGTSEFEISSYCLTTEIESLKVFLKNHYKGKTIPGQPVDKNGKPLKSMVYNSVTIKVKSKDMVESAVSYFRKLGYETESNIDYLKDINKTFMIVEVVLGGIGAISLLVAAIGIANTMTMAIYERTKEIGVMKVLGCDLKNIKTMFLTEAGFVGFFGGVVGIILSYIISTAANAVSSEMLSAEMEINITAISVIPPWLALFAIIFSTIIGMLAGYFPANRAMKLSPLAAIRNE